MAFSPKLTQDLTAASPSLKPTLGATRRHIAGQFLTEAVLLSVLGGLAGTIIGIIAGLYPAIRTARLPPAQALRTV
jgi:ABC-type antimicrobial peptide transport system permease subunit